MDDLRLTQLAASFLAQEVKACNKPKRLRGVIESTETHLASTEAIANLATDPETLGYYLAIMKVMNEILTLAKARLEHLERPQ